MHTKSLTKQWIDAETRCATIEANIRQQVTTEMTNELRNIEAMYMASTDKENVSDDQKESNKKQMDMSLLVEQVCITAALNSIDGRLSILI